MLLHWGTSHFRCGLEAAVIELVRPCAVRPKRKTLLLPLPRPQILDGKVPLCWRSEKRYGRDQCLL